MHRENKFCIGVFQHKINPECLIRSQPRIHRDKRKIDRLVRKLTDHDEMLNGVEHTNFFENRATEYSKAATTGSWEEVFVKMDSKERKL